MSQILCLDWASLGTAGQPVSSTVLIWKASSSGMRFLVLTLRVFKLQMFRGKGRICLFFFKRHCLGFFFSPRLLLNWINNPLVSTLNRMDCHCVRCGGWGFFFFKVMGMCASLHEFMCTIHMQVSLEASRGYWIPWNWGYCKCEPVCGCWTLNLGPGNE